MEIPTILIALESITFGKRVTRWTEIPASLFELKSDKDFYDATILYLLRASRYRKHLNEEFTIIFK